MKYARQTQEQLDRLDISLNKLYMLVKRGEQSEALRFMKEGELKECFDDLRSIIKLSSTGTLGARGTSQTGTL